MAKKMELGQSGLGDITDILHNHGVSDLSWLDVDENDYQKACALPKQNLDIIPELQRALTFDEGNVPALIPLRPHTIVNTNPLDPPGAPQREAAKEIVHKIARYVMGGLEPKEVGEKLKLEFSEIQLRNASDEIVEVMAERGLLGNVYVDAKHFPRCAQDGDDRKFVASRARRAKYVLAKEQCAGCVCNCDGTCSSFKKRLVEEVPYDDATMAHYAVQLVAEKRLAGKIPQDGQARRILLRESFRNRPVATGESVRTIQHHPVAAKPAVTEEDIKQFMLRAAEAKPAPLDSKFLAASRHLMSGGDPQMVAASPDPSIRRLASEHGLLGHTWLDMDALGGCKATMSFIATRGISPDFLVRRSFVCSSCKDAPDGACACLRQQSNIVNDVPTVGREQLVSALMRAASRGAITMDDVRRASVAVSADANWRALIAQANLLQSKPSSKEYEGGKVSFHHGDPDRNLGVASMDADEVRRTIAHMMNSGLCGKALQAAILQRYSRSDLAQVPHIGARLAAHDGIQGQYFVDPTAYLDYGKGCSTGSKHFRKRGAENVLASDSCTGCSMQTAPGWCAKYSKSLIRQIPSEEVERAEELRKHMAAPVGPDAPVENPVTQYELASELMVDSRVEMNVPEIGFSDRDVAGEK